MTEAPRSLASSFQSCQRQFDQILPYLDKRVEDHNSIQPSWTDEAARFRLWGTNIGAGQTHKATSLDFRLRDAETVRLQIDKDLAQLNEALDEALQILAATRSDGSSTGLDASAKTDEAPSQPVPSAHVVDFPAADGDADDDDELAIVYEDVVSIISSLFRMTLYIRNPARRDQNRRRNMSEVAGFEAWDISHIKDKFPQVDLALAQRLGKANTIRRANLKYWENHHKKLALDDSADEDEETLSESIATKFQQITLDADEVQSQISGTSYTSSFASGEGMRIPKLPDAGRNSAPFECPICFYIITASNQREWMTHVFFDLQPYLCPYKDCRSPEKLYESRSQWFNHILNNHLTIAEGGGPPLVKCGMCGDSIRSLILAQRHLGRHLRQIALFALPGSLFENDLEENERAEFVSHSSEEVLGDDDEVNQPNEIIESKGDPIHPPESPSAESRRKRASSVGDSPQIKTIIVEQPLIARDADRQHKIREEFRVEKKMTEPLSAAGSLERGYIESHGTDDHLNYSDERIGESIAKKSERDTKDQGRGVDLTRPTYIKVNKKHLSPDTLEHYRLPWKWDERNPDYIIITQYIDENLQVELFEHTRRALKLQPKPRPLQVPTILKDPKNVRVEKDKDGRIYLVRTKRENATKITRFLESPDESSDEPEDGVAGEDTSKAASTKVT